MVGPRRRHPASRRPGRPARRSADHEAAADLTRRSGGRPTRSWYREASGRRKLISSPTPEIRLLSDPASAAAVSASDPEITPGAAPEPEPARQNGPQVNGQGVSPEL